MARRDEQIDRIEPRLERRTGIFKNRAGSRVNVVAAMRAGKGTAVAHAVERRESMALAARMLHAEANVHDVLEASFVIREPGEEVANRKQGCFALVHALNIGQLPYLRQGDNSKNIYEFCSFVNERIAEAKKKPFAARFKLTQIEAPSGQMFRPEESANREYGSAIDLLFDPAKWEEDQYDEILSEVSIRSQDPLPHAAIQKQSQTKTPQLKDRRPPLFSTKDNKKTKYIFNGQTRWLEGNGPRCYYHHRSDISVASWRINERRVR